MPRLEEFEQTSVYYAATQVEAQLCVNDPVVVVGGGNSAGQAGAVPRRPRPQGPADGARATASTSSCRATWPTGSCTIRAIEVHLHTEVRELVGEHGQLEAVVVQDTETGDRHDAARARS